MWNASEMSSSTSEMFLPPSAVACEEVGKFKKLKTLVLSCALRGSMGVQNSTKSNMRYFRVIVLLFRVQR